MMKSTLGRNAHCSSARERPVQLKSKRSSYADMTYNVSYEGIGIVSRKRSLLRAEIDGIDLLNELESVLDTVTKKKGKKKSPLFCTEQKSVDSM